MPETFAGLSIDENLSESLLGLIWRGPPPYRIGRWLALGALVAALAGIVHLSWEGYQHLNGIPDQQGEVPIYAMVVAISLFLTWSPTRTCKFNRR
jgi:hypothetical protein